MMMPNKILKVAVYCRVSTDKDDQANSLESQQKYFQEYIERNPMWELYNIYVDEGISGTSTKKRKAFNKMMLDAELKKFDMIITKEISRFARNTLDSIYYTRQLKDLGVGVMFVNDNLYTLDPDAELRLAIMSSIAQEESRKTSERVKWGQKRRMEQGVVFGRDMVGYDVKDGKLIVNPESAKVVQKVFHKYVVEQKGTSTIARELREEGISTFRNSDWTNTVILRMLRNEKYCGDLIQKKTITPNYLTHEKVMNKGQEEFVVIRNHHEPIISRELFEKAQRELERRSPSDEQKAKLGRRYCFSGKIKCGECGNSYVFRNKKLDNGKRHHFWECYNKKKYGKTKRIDPITKKDVGCDCPRISDVDLKIIMYRIIDTLMIDKENVIRKMKAQLFDVINEGEFENYDLSKKQLDEIKEKRASLVDLYLDKVITKEEFKQKAEELDAEIVKREIEVNKSSKFMIDTDGVDVVKICTDYAKEIIENGELDDDFIKAILDEMVIHKDKTIDVKLNLIPEKWKYAIETMNLDENKAGNGKKEPLIPDLPTSVRSPFNSG